MARTPSNMIPLGTPAPGFTLPDAVSGCDTAFTDIVGEQATVVMIICNHCPYVLQIIAEVVAVAKAYQPRGVGFVAISCNDIDAYPQDAPDKMRAMAQQHGFTFPYLYDASQAVARAYDAACTPEFYVFTAAAGCVYRGQFDGARPGRDVPVSGADLRGALDATLRGETIPEADQVPSQGCGIKWKSV